MHKPQQTGAASLVQRLILLAGLVLVPFSAARAQESPPGPVHIYFSAGCGDCWPYVQEVLIPTLRQHGVQGETVIHDYTRPEERRQLLETSDALGLPRTIADSLMAFVPYHDSQLVILGHVPESLLRQVLSTPDLPPRLAVWQPEMHGEPTEYRLWAWTGQVVTFPIDTPFAQALPLALASEGPPPPGAGSLAALLPAVVATGLVDSVNPCAIAVILLLLAFLFTIRQSRGRILRLGLVYVAAIYLVYYAIGLGLLRAVRLADDPHFVARLGSGLLVLLGALNLVEYFRPNFPIRLHMPRAALGPINDLMRRTTVPATAALGMLVGLCTFPCSGGVYVSIITLLNARTSLAWGLSYLALYNLLYVLPLLIILAGAANRQVAKAWARWEREHSRNIRLAYGIAMIALGVSLLVWVLE